MRHLSGDGLICTWARHRRHAHTPPPDAFQNPQQIAKLASLLPLQVKSKSERGLGSAGGRFRLAAPCFARISQRHLITHRSCHVHKVAARRWWRSVEIRTLFLCPPPCLLPSTNSVRSLPPALASHGRGIIHPAYMRHCSGL